MASSFPCRVFRSILLGMSTQYSGIDTSNHPSPYLQNIACRAVARMNLSIIMGRERHAYTSNEKQQRKRTR